MTPPETLVQRGLRMAQAMIVLMPNAPDFVRTAMEMVDHLQALEEALTPSAKTKSAYLGEFGFTFPAFDAEGEKVKFTPNVPWTTIKEIMAAIRAQAEKTGATKMLVDADWLRQKTETDPDLDTDAGPPPPIVDTTEDLDRPTLNPMGRAWRDGRKIVVYVMPGFVRKVVVWKQFAAHHGGFWVDPDKPEDPGWSSHVLYGWHDIDIEPGQET